jgi:hypothetical protein
VLEWGSLGSVRGALSNERPYRDLRNVGANYPFESSHRFPGISRILASETVTGNDTETLVFLTYAPPPPPEPAALFVDPSEPFPPTPMSSFEELKSPGSLHCVVPAVRKTIVAALADGAKKQTEIRQRCRNAKRNGAPRNVPQFNYFFFGLHYMPLLYSTVLRGKNFERA